MENDEQTVEEILALVEQLLQVAGDPDWVMQFLQGGIKVAQEGGGEQPMGAPPPQGAPPMETVSKGGPGSMGKIAPMKTGLGMN